MTIAAELGKRSGTVYRVIWPLKEKELRKHIDTPHRYRQMLGDLVTAYILATATSTHSKAEELIQTQVSCSVFVYSACGGKCIQTSAASHVQEQAPGSSTCHST